MITKTAIGNYLRKQSNGDVGMYRNGFKDGVAWAQRRLEAKTRPATRDEKIVNPGVYVVQAAPVQPVQSPTKPVNKPMYCGSSHCSCIECVMEVKP